MRRALMLLGTGLVVAGFLLVTLRAAPQEAGSPAPDWAARFSGLQLLPAQEAGLQGMQQWPPNDRTRAVPAIITPGTASTQNKPGRPPSDAIVLFNGKDLSNWESVKVVFKNNDRANSELVKNGPAEWTVGKGYFATVPGKGYIETKDAYGDCQLHVEWATPNPPHGHDQDRGNSGIFLHGLYEIQVLDSYDNVTYADGQAGAVYGQYPPQVNASRQPGEWQTYDIIFHGPRFDANGKLTRPAIVTVIYNGVLVQDDVALSGPTQNRLRPLYRVTPEKLPLALQDHHHPVKYRNLWIRELKEGQ